MWSLMLLTSAAVPGMTYYLVNEFKETMNKQEEKMKEKFLSIILQFATSGRCASDDRQAVSGLTSPRMKEREAIDASARILKFPNATIGVKWIGDDIKEMMLSLGRKLIGCFSQTTVQIPVTVLQLFMNSSACEIRPRGTKDEDVEWNVYHIRMTQPHVNSRLTAVKDIWNPELVDLRERTMEQYGTLETAIGRGKHAMNTQEYKILPYEVADTNDSPTGPPNIARVCPTLQSLPQDCDMVGSPFGRKLTMGTAVRLFEIMVGKSVDDYYGDEVKDLGASIEGEPDRMTLERHAMQVFAATMEWIALRYHGLETDRDWMDLYEHLRHFLSQDMIELKSDGDNQAGPYIMKDHIAKVKNMNQVMYACGLMLRSITPARIAVMDGLRRVTGAVYGILQRLPETGQSSMEAGAKNLTREEHQSGLECTYPPDLSVLSKSGPVTFLIPRAGSGNRGSSGNHFSSKDITLCRAYSELVQEELSSIKPRNFADFVGSLCAGIKESNESSFGIAKPGELEIPKGKITTEHSSERNRASIGSFWHHCLEEMVTEHANSVNSLVTRAKKQMIYDLSQENKGTPVDPDQSIQNRVFIRKTEELWDNYRVRPPYARGSLPASRPDIAALVFLFGNYVFDVDSCEGLRKMVMGEMDMFLAASLVKESPATMLPKYIKHCVGGYPGIPAEYGGKIFKVSDTSTVRPCIEPRTSMIVIRQFDCWSPSKSCG